MSSSMVRTHTSEWEVVQAIPQQPQRQDSLHDQLRMTMVAANRLGCYDAADRIARMLLRSDGSE